MPQQMSHQMSQLQAQLLSYLPHGIKAFIDGSSRRDLLRKIDTCLLVFDNQVADIESGRVIKFQEQLEPADPELLASACKSLLADNGGEGSILLLMPPSLFIATCQLLPGVNKDNIVAALTLQTESLLPANTSSVSLAINPKAAEHSSEPAALWIRNDAMIGLFDAFAQQDLFVAAIKPRVLNLQPDQSGYLDADSSNLTFVETTQDVLLRWVQTTRGDLEQAELQQQWQNSITNETGSQPTELKEIRQYLNLVDRQNCADYSFFPQGALNARRQVEKGRKLVMAAAAVVAVLILSSVPFLFQSFQFRSLAATLEAERELSFEARQDQAIVVNFENEFGVIDDFPEQRIRDAMFTLQNALSPNQLSSLEITKGQINIQGTSTEPQSILQRLERDPMFTEVAFSRATNNDRYFIGLRLSTVNFDAYMVRYFPDE